MKNKKLLTRLFALLASIVLVFALALPCFAEETDQPPIDYVPVLIRSYDDLVIYGLEENVSYLSLFYCNYLGQVSSGRCVFSSNSSFGTVEVTYTGNGTQYGSVFSETLTLGTISDVGYSYTLVYFDGSEESETIPLEDVEFTLLIFVPASSTPTDPTTPSSDMYSNLFNILKDAVYGSDAELTGSQEYALTLISTILTYATILLPVILVIFIAVWCFKRF